MKTAITTAAAALALFAIATPAAASQQEQMSACKAELVAGGHAASADQLDFKRAKRTAVTFEIDGDTKATCKFARGKLTKVTVDGRDYALGEKADTAKAVESAAN